MSSYLSRLQAAGGLKQPPKAPVKAKAKASVGPAISAAAKPKAAVAAVGPAGAVGPAPRKPTVGPVVKAAAKKLPAHPLGAGEAQFTPKEAKGLVPGLYKKPSDPVTKALVRQGLAKVVDGRVYPDNATNASSLQAPVLKVLDQTTRPIHAIAAAADAAVTGKNILHAAKQGIENKDKASFSRVLKHLGAPKAVQDVGGFVGDVGLDPTTYLSLGTAVPEEVAARSAVRAGERDAVKGVTVKLAGHQVPGVTRATAKAGRGLQKAGSAAADKPVGRQLSKGGATTKDLTRDVRPSIAPAGADKAQFAAARTVTSRARASANQATAEALRQSRGLAARLTKLSDHGVTHEQIAHALDTGSLEGLPAVAHSEVQDIAQRFAQLKALRTEAGVKEGTIENYFPRAREDALHARLGIVSSDTEHVATSGLRRAGPRLGSSRTRVDPRPLHEINAERVADGKSKFSTDVPLVYANYAKETGRAVAENKAVRGLADLGRPYHEGELLKPNEAVYHLGYKDKRLGLRPYKEGDKVPADERLVVLDHKTIETVQKRIAPAQAGSTIGKGIDKTTALFKRVATFTPGFHVRNAIGDTQMAYLSQPGHTLPRNIAQAVKANRANVRLEKHQAQSLSGLIPDSGKTIKVAGNRMPVEEFARLAREHGVTNSGQIGRELKDLAVKGESSAKVSGRLGRAVRKPVAKVEPTVRGRENVIRMATFKHGLDKGMTPAEAAKLSLETHIDYGDLTELERTKLRRAMPFYTFTARSTPLHLKKLVTNPGKFANYEKLRENVATATGADLGTGLTDQQQRQAPLVIKVGGKTYTAGASLPLASALDLAPTSLNPLKPAGEAAQVAAGLLNPLIKTPVESYLNRSFYFRNDIENKTNPLVAAPAWVKYLPPAAKKALWVETKTDARTGKPVLKWRGKADYWMKSFTPGPGNTINQLLASGTNRAGQGGFGKALAGTLGVKVQPVDALSAQIGQGEDALTAMNTHLAAIKPNKGAAPSRDYLKLKAQADALAAQINAWSVKRGDSKPLGKKAKGAGTLDDLAGPKASTQTLDDLAAHTGSVKTLDDLAGGG